MVTNVDREELLEMNHDSSAKAEHPVAITVAVAGCCLDATSPITAEFICRSWELLCG